MRTISVRYNTIFSRSVSQDQDHGPPPLPYDVFVKFANAVMLRENMMNLRAKLIKSANLSGRLGTIGRGSQILAGADRGLPLRKFSTMDHDLRAACRCHHWIAAGTTLWAACRSPECRRHVQHASFDLHFMRGGDSCIFGMNRKFGFRALLPKGDSYRNVSCEACTGRSLRIAGNGPVASSDLRGAFSAASASLDASVIIGSILHPKMPGLRRSVSLALSWVPVSSRRMRPTPRTHRASPGRTPTAQRMRACVDGYTPG
jgi:hypothetical protein